MSTTLPASPRMSRAPSRFPLNKRPQPPQTPTQLPVKADSLARQIIDRLTAGALLIVSAPFIAVSMLAIRVTSKGPALYRQKRVGRGGEVFTIFKLRTMFVNCESQTGPRWSTPGDTRITRLGKVLRALHIDELPQLWNVLCGEMSIVGPRPERPEICKELRNFIIGYDLRHAVKPGITGFAQVHLPPDSCVQSVRNKIAYDRYYLAHRSWRLDLRILICTGMKVLQGKALYQRKPRRPTED